MCEGWEAGYLPLQVDGNPQVDRPPEADINPQVDRPLQVDIDPQVGVRGSPERVYVIPGCKRGGDQDRPLVVMRCRRRRTGRAWARPGSGLGPARPGPGSGPARAWVRPGPGPGSGSTQGRLGPGLGTENKSKNIKFDVI